MRHIIATVIGCAGLVLAASAAGAGRGELQHEVWTAVPMPDGIHVEATELHGPVFADVSGHTLYVWPSKGMRNGVAGEDKGKIICENAKVTESAGLMSIYPAGLELPDLDMRPTCTQVWPPLAAAAEAKPIGAWTILTRKDGAKQWAYQGQAVYISSLDHQAGDVLGTVMRPVNRDDTSPRLPIGPPADLPPGFGVETTYMGRLMHGPKGMSVYTWDKDTATKSFCDDACLASWEPVRAPVFFRAHGEWGVVTRSVGIQQITYRGKPLYIHPSDHGIRAQEGADEPGWHNVYTQKAPPLPEGFGIQDMTQGQVLADAKGRTIYYYSCDEDAVDQLSCDHPGTTQVYRLAICGNGDPRRCLDKWPLVPAPAAARATSRTWTIIDIDPMTGNLAKAGDAGAMRVWAYRGRPIYTYSGDHKPGDLWGNGLGELIGKHNGYKAFVVREDK